MADLKLGFLGNRETMDLAQEASAAELLKQQSAFVYEFFQAAELEARATERYVLIALATMYSYLAANGTAIPPQFRELAWCAPTLVTVFAGIRALGLGRRQKQMLDYLKEIEARLPPPGEIPGWAHWFSKQVPFVAISAGVFYLLLTALTVFVAYKMI
jgi:hypothetical protein